MIERPAEYRRELRRQDLVEAKHLLRQALVSRHQQPGGARPGIAETEQIEQRRHVRFERALPVERLREVEHQTGIGPAQRVDDRHDVSADGGPRHLVAQAANGFLDLAEHRILRCLARFRSVQQRDVHRVAS